MIFSIDLGERKKVEALCICWNANSIFNSEIRRVNANTESIYKVLIQDKLIASVEVDFDDIIYGNFKDEFGNHFSVETLKVKKGAKSLIYKGYNCSRQLGVDYEVKLDTNNNTITIFRQTSAETTNFGTINDYLKECIVDLNISINEYNEYIKDVAMSVANDIRLSFISNPEIFK